MSSARYDVLGIGNAIVDVLAPHEHDFLVKQGMNKGAMALIDEGAGASESMTRWGGRRWRFPAARLLQHHIGGSRASAAVAPSSVKVKDDNSAMRFSHDIRAAGSRSRLLLRNRASTGRCYVLVTPDGERTMNTYLGAAQDLHPSDIDMKA